MNCLVNGCEKLVYMHGLCRGCLWLARNSEIVRRQIDEAERVYEERAFARAEAEVALEKSVAERAEAEITGDGRQGVSVPVGTIVSRKYRDGFQQYQKVSDTGNNRWEPLSRIVYEREIGPIPQGYRVVFKDGDTMNVATTNLEAISGKECATRYGRAKFNRERGRKAANIRWKKGQDNA